MRTSDEKSRGRRKALSRLFPHSLYWQIVMAISGLAVLVLAAGLVALFGLRENTEMASQLAEERLVRMQEAQDLVRRTLLIERESYRLIGGDSPENMRDIYSEIVEQLDGLDSEVSHLAAASDDVSILSLHQNSQSFRNMLHVVAGLYDRSIQGAGAGTPPADATSVERLRQFHSQLQQHTVAMVSSSQELSSRITADYQDAIGVLAGKSRQQQGRVLALLGGGLLVAWLITDRFLVRHILKRLNVVSRHLRRREDSGPSAVPVVGDDEIGLMARAVEQFLADRRKLAETNKALQAERERQEVLIKELAQAQSQLLQSEKLASIGQLAAGVAHEINNPVGFVNSNLGTMRQYLDDLFRTLSAYETSEGELKSETRAALENLKREIDLAYVREDADTLLNESIEGLQRIRRIVQDLKDFSHVDESETQFANLERGLDSTLNIVWNELKYKAEVVKEYGGIPEIECIPSQINQVFLNLLVNAGHAIEGRGLITVRTGCDKDNVWVEVEDTGCGIRPEHLGRIFDPFFTTKPVGVGTGLGLSMSYGIVKKHGGYFDVKSEVGRGTCFRVVLPIAKPAPPGTVEVAEDYSL